MKNKYRILKIIVTVVLLGFLLSFSLKRFSNQKITADKITVQLNNGNTPVYFLDEALIKKMVDKINPTSRLGNANVPALEKEINQIPAVKKANVYLNLNGKLHLDVQQRVPVFRLKMGNSDFYVDETGASFPTSSNYAHPCMLVTGNIPQSDYLKLAQLVKYIDQDAFCKKYFIGISKDQDNYNLLTSDANYKVEIGDLDNIEFKVKGFKAFVEKFLVFQDPQKYTRISVKYNNQIVTTLNPYFKENDSILKIGEKELAKTPITSIKTQDKKITNATAKTVSKTKQIQQAPKKEKQEVKKKESAKTSQTKKKPEPKKQDNTLSNKKNKKPKAKVKIE